MREMSSRELHEVVHQALEEVTRRLESGELDGSGRYYTDEELAVGAALNGKPAPTKPIEAKSIKSSTA